jgi:monoamine oxidase
VHCKKSSFFAADAIVLGAGVAGLRATQELWNANYRNILLIEQRDRVGGRMWEEPVGLPNSPHGQVTIMTGEEVRPVENDGFILLCILR